MPIKRIFWSGHTGRDIHVLRGGFSRDLTHRALRFVHTDGSRHFADDYLVQFADVTLKFTPLFKGAMQPDHFTFVGDHNGITVNTGVGSVSVDAAVPLNIKNNFIIEVEARNDTGKHEVFHETIRVQVHASVTQVWLTPNQLTIRPPLVTWTPKTNYSVGESLVDTNRVLQVVSGVTARVTQVAISDNVLTLTVNQNFAVGGKVALANLTAAAFLNGQTVTVKSATATQITADFTHTDFVSDDNGDATANAGSGLSGDGPALPAFSDVEDERVTDKQLIWTSQGPHWSLNTDYRFSVRAQFDDGTVGDLTDNHGVTWDPAGHLLQSDGSVSLLAADNADDKYFVAATLPVELGGATTPVGPTVQIGRKWADEAVPPTLTIVAGGGLPQAGAAENSPNILMLCDGFRSQDQPSFDGIVDTFVSNIKTNQLNKPYNLLSSRMNFWKAFAPTDQVGISFRSEVYVIGIDSFARPIPAVEKPPKPGDPWGIEHVLYAVGLPVPADKGDARTPAVLKAEWRTLLQTDPTPNISDDLVRRWKEMANRSFIEERDGFPGLSYGEPPAASQEDTTQLDMHQDRAGVVGLRSFYRVLANNDIKLADGRPVGVLWAEKIFRFDNTDLVAILSSFPGGRALNGTGYIALSTRGGDAYIPISPAADKNELTLNFTDVPTEVEADRSRTVAHELGHSFGLGDEYADSNAPFSFPRDHADPSAANLQTEGDSSIIPDPNHPDQKIISGDQIPWVWHRILAATVVNGDISQEGLDTFRIPVEPDVSFRFVLGDELLLRPRERGKPLRKFQSFEISKALIVQEVDTDSLLVRALGAISAQAFPAGSLLFKPKPAPASVLSATYPYAEMIAKNIKDLITTNKKPLTVVPCVLDQDDTQLPILDEGGSEHRTPVANLRPSVADLTRIVGLYAGGSLSTCGIFHPTGHCMMRHHHEIDSEFCAVCRYIIVDMIAPEFHPEIDSDYDRIYPLV